MMVVQVGSIIEAHLPRARPPERASSLPSSVYVLLGVSGYDSCCSIPQRISIVTRNQQTALQLHMHVETAYQFQTIRSTQNPAVAGLNTLRRNHPAVVCERSSKWPRAETLVGSYAETCMGANVQVLQPALYCHGTASYSLSTFILAQQVHSQSCTPTLNFNHLCV